MAKKLFELLHEAEELMRQAEIEDAKNDAWLLWEYVSGMSRTKYLLCQREKLDVLDADGKWQTAYQTSVQKRLKHIPLQYITGVQSFCGLEFSVNESVLIPRQDTEVLVEQVLKLISSASEKKDGEQPLRILDMCTGSGCIAVSVKKLAKIPTEVVAVDISDEALFVAQKNAAQNDCRITFYRSDLFTELGGQSYDLILSNPPYIRSEEIPKLMEEVREHEPHLALDGDEDGLAFYEKITSAAPRHLNDGGFLIYEIGYDQAEEVSGILQKNGFTGIRVIKDYAGLDRVVMGKYEDSKNDTI
jgi:release factor glutamine methyltransferase